MNKIACTLPLELRWLSLIRQWVSGYAQAVKFTPALEEMLLHSVEEACGELLRRAEELRIDGNFRLELGYTGEALEIALAYNRKIPLNPLKDAPYEVPDGEADLDEIQIDALWLFLIKRYMDRVYFQTDGSDHVLRMQKFTRAEGAEKRVWVMGLTPRLKPELNLNLRRSAEGAILGGFIQDFETSALLKVGPAEAYALSQMNGQRTCYEIYLQAVEEGLLLSPVQLTALYEALEQKQMLALPEAPKPSPWRWLTNIHNLSFSIPHADAVVTAVHRVAKPLFSRVGIWLMLLIGLSGLYPLMHSKAHFLDLMTQAQEILLHDWWVILPIYGISLLTVALHELGHGVCCKHYGGTVPRLGITYYLSGFIFFCDVSASYNFPEKWPRIAVSLAGPFVTFVTWSLSCWCFYWCEDPLWQFIWNMVLFSETIGLIMNFNPFLRMDAYYMLMDWTGIANLRDKATQYVTALFTGKREKYVGYPASLQRWLLGYGLVGGAMTVLMFVYPFAVFLPRLLQGSEGWLRIGWTLFVLLLAVGNLCNFAYQKFRAMRHQTYKL